MFFNSGSGIYLRMSEQRSTFMYLAVALIAIVGGYLIWSTFVKPDGTGEM